MVEVWKHITGYEDYEISNMGRIKNCHKILTPPLTAKGYVRHNLYKNKKPKSFRLHRIVLQEFIGPCPDGKVGAHLNGIKTDNRLENLQWVTPKENEHHKLLHNTRASGERHGRAKLSFKNVSYIKKNAIVSGINGTWNTSNVSELAKKFGVSGFIIRAIAKGTLWTALEDLTEPLDEALKSCGGGDNE